ncbi:HEPN domain-containing protein [Thermococcus chitonophagus]|uniref:HEPN domain-containing protein n=1 Tax=Thermococcus chitonophagus TaxID=54262 RepID=A0A2Z2NDU8_9EURY|nr:HEPN domain-containing protein [Thermococcus chitonophagus]
MSLKRAEEWLIEAEANLKFASYRTSLIASYLAMFHSARALLFRDGWREKSHFCVARFLEEFYVKTGKLEREWVDLLDRMRELRHADQYDVSYSPTKEEAEEALKLAKQFVGKIKKILGNQTLGEGNQ